MRILTSGFPYGEPQRLNVAISRIECLLLDQAGLAFVGLL